MRKVPQATPMRTRSRKNVRAERTFPSLAVPVLSQKRDVCECQNALSTCPVPNDWREQAFTYFTNPAVILGHTLRYVKSVPHRMRPPIRRTCTCEKATW